jgi:putative sigma-54 modulation protein
MNINIKGTNMELTDAIREHLNNKLSGLDKLVDNDKGEANAQVELGRTTNHHKSGEVYRAEINVMMSGRAIRAVSEMEDLYAAITDMSDEIFREVKKAKSRDRSMVRRGGQRIKNMMRGIFGQD